MKLIKIKENFYVVGKAEEGVNPEVKHFDNKVDENSIHKSTSMDDEIIYYFVRGIKENSRTIHEVTHSTQQLEGVELLDKSEIEELVYGYSVEKIADELWRSPYSQLTSKSSFKKGFQAAMEINKDKICISVEDFKKEAYNFFTIYQTNDFDNDGLEKEFERILDLRLKNYLPRTEWDVEIINNKIELI